MVEDDEMVCRSFQVAIRNNAAFSLAGKTGSQKEAMQMLLSLDVDVMLLDLELDEGDGMHLLEEMRAKLERLPEIITVTNTSSESVLSCVRELGSDFVYQKHNGAYSPENVLEIIQMTFPYYQNKTADQTQVLAAEYSLEKEREYQRVYIRRELEKMGFTAQKRGTYFWQTRSVWDWKIRNTGNYRSPMTFIRSWRNKTVCPSVVWKRASVTRSNMPGGMRIWQIWCGIIRLLGVRRSDVRRTPSLSQTWLSVLN